MSGLNLSRLWFLIGAVLVSLSYSALASSSDDEILKAQAAAQEADFVGAREHALKAKSVAPDDPAAEGAYALYSFFAGGPKDASSRMLENLVKKHPESPEALMYRGMFYREIGQIDASFADLSKALELKSDLPDAHRYRGLIYEQRHQPLHAIDDFSTVLNTPSKLGLDYFYRGRILFSQNKIAESIRDFDEAERLKIFLPELYKCRGMAKIDMHLYTQAEKDLTKSLEMHPSDSSVLFSRSEAFLQQGKFDKAISDLSEASKLTPEAPEIYGKRGQALRLAGKLKEAASDLERVAKLRGSASDFTNLGMAYSLMNKHKEALIAYETSLSKDPKIAMTYNNIGTAYVSLGQYEKAFDSYAKAIELDTAYSRKLAGGVGAEFAFANRAKLYSRLGKHDKAIEDVSKLLSCRVNATDNSSWFFFRSAEYLKKGDLANSLNDTIRAIWLLPRWIQIEATGGVAAVCLIVAIVLKENRKRHYERGQQKTNASVDSL